MLKAPAGETAGQKYTVLLYAFLDLQQSAIDARTAEIKTEIEAEWKVRLRLNDGEVERLSLGRMCDAANGAQREILLVLTWLRRRRSGRRINASITPCKS